MDAYAFAREAEASGIDQLRALVGERDAVASFLPTVGAYSAFVKVSSDDPVALREALSEIAGIESLIGIETMVGTSPAARGELQFPDRLRERRDLGSVSKVSLDIWDLLPPPPPPPPMPTSGVVRDCIGFQLLSCDAGSTSEVYAQVAQTRGLVGLAVVSHMSTAVLAELTGPDEHSVAIAAEMAATARGVTDAALSIGFVADAIGFRTE